MEILKFHDENEKMSKVGLRKCQSNLKKKKKQIAFCRKNLPQRTGQLFQQPKPTKRL